jgi:hypothetical protein
LLVSGFNFTQALASKDPAATFLLSQLVNYALGPEFAPSQTLPVEFFKAKVKK